MKKLKRLARYLIGRERFIITMPRQGMQERIDVWTDTDYVGCNETRKSTSGGVIQSGLHTL